MHLNVLKNILVLVVMTSCHLLSKNFNHLHEKKFNAFKDLKFTLASLVIKEIKEYYQLYFFWSSTYPPDYFHLG